jgi:hypothetical protein
MANIYNSDLINEIREGGKIQQNVDNIPNQLADKVVPVMEVNPKILRRINIIKAYTSAATGESTVYTTPTDKDFYLVGYSLNSVKNAACDGTNVYMEGVLSTGEAITIDYWLSLTLTADKYNNSMSFSQPILLKRGSVIKVATNFGVGAQTKTALIYGYTVDNIKA